MLKVMNLPFQCYLETLKIRLLHNFFMTIKTFDVNKLF